MSYFKPESDLAARSTEITAALSHYRDVQERFAWLVEQARARDLLPPDLRRDEFLVPGCQVRLWFVPEFREDRCWFRLDSDAASLKAVAGLLCDFYSGQSPTEISATPPEFLDVLGLGTNLAESRRRTIWRVREMIRTFAKSHLPTQ